MGTIEEDYKRFLGWMRESTASADAKRIAKIINNNLIQVVNSVSAGGQRARILAPLLRVNLVEMPEEIEAAPADALVARVPWNRLQKLVLGPFRGFRREEQFDLTTSVVLIYGPNGSGKTSLCEAIEFALLGSVEEAFAKRIDSLGDYLDNIHEGYHILPQLWAEVGDEAVPVLPQEDVLRFAIIEKSRIEGFAPLAARTPAQANAALATLFGLDAFNEFVNNFTATLDSQLQLETPKKTALDLKRAALDAAARRVASSTASLDALTGESETSIIEEMTSIEERLSNLTDRLQEQIPVASGVSVSAVTALRRTLRGKIGDLARCRKELSERSAQVSYRALFGAVQELESSAADTCPACETPLTTTKTNPFERAKSGLALLQDLADLEQRRDRLMRECDQLSARLRENVLIVDRLGLANATALGLLVSWARSEDPTPIWSQAWFDRKAWRSCLRLGRVLEQRDVEIRDKLSRQSEIADERDRLHRARESLIERKTRREMLSALVQEEQQHIDTFSEINAVLIAAAEAEDTAHKLEIRIQSAYAGYVDSIRKYRDDLPATMLTDLSETTRDLYNLFNADDYDADKLDKVVLPLRGGDRIQVSFRGSPGKMHDALIVLSEGHLRCLGLAILLAKNIKNELPLVVFDDAVNAIDHDHRAGIRSTIFGDPRISSKQIVLTCHSNEFIKDIHNQLGDKVSKLYVLDHHAGDHQPRVRGGGDRHYLRRASERLADGDMRQCLASCRQSLENLTSRLWKALINKSEALGKFPVVLRSPAATPELRGLSEQLQRKLDLGLRQGILKGDPWTQRHAGLQEILSIPEMHMAWQYLNKGTHDEQDREDFEAGVVRKIVDALTKISDSFSV